MARDVNQHVARDSNAAHRRVLLQTVAHMNTPAFASGGRLSLLGDMNAALEGVDGAILCIARLVKQIVSLWNGRINEA